MTNAFVGYDELVNRFDSIERERKSLIDWYKRRVEIMSSRLEEEKLSK